jgi:uncharacterized protein YkwD
MMTFRLLRDFAFCLLVLGTCTAQAGAPPRAIDLNGRLLAAHNLARKAVNVPPLVWSDALAAAAKGWATTLARSGRFEHAPQPSDKSAQGENLWMGTASAYTPEDMVGAWTDEKKYYVRGIFPKISTTQNWSDVGHYTQMIWHNTTAVGCALVSGGEDDYLVCRYSPAGNWIGQDPQGSRPTEKQIIKKKPR